MTTSGTYNFDLSNSDVVLEAFDRCEIRPPAITGNMMISARRSINLELQRWANLGVNLWAVDLITENLIQGVTTYSIPLETVDLLDVYIRQFTLTSTFNVTPSFSTVINTEAVTITVSNHGLVPGNFIDINTPIAVGGAVLSGYYEVETVPSTNTFTIAAASNATSTVNNGGAVPQFSVSSGQSTVSVHLPNHSYTINQLFNVSASTMLGGNILYGAYTVVGVTDANNFGISTPLQATFTDSEPENGGLAQIGAQASSVNPTDYIITPLGRSDYAGIPDKQVQGRPTSYWFDRTNNPTITLWQVPDSNGPYQLGMYRMRRMQDANFANGQTPDVTYRQLDALCGQLACRLAMKYAKAQLPIIKADADRAWQESEMEDRERAQLQLAPDLTGYYR